MGFGTIAALGIIALLVYPVLGVAKAGTLPEDWLRALVERWAGLSGLNPAVIYGVVMVESGGNPDARNPSDPSVGLMQVTPLIGRAYAGLKGDDGQVLLALLAPETNMRAGTGFLRHLQDRYTAKGYVLHEWLQAYNMGETNFDKGFRNDYGDRVVAAMRGWINA